jgi:hypothetical protein
VGDPQDHLLIVPFHHGGRRICRSGE